MFVLHSCVWACGRGVRVGVEAWALLWVLFVGVPTPASAQHSQGYFIFSVIFCCLLHLCFLCFSYYCPACLPHCAQFAPLCFACLTVLSPLCLACFTVPCFPHCFLLSALYFQYPTVPVLNHYASFAPLCLACPTVPY